MEIEMGKLIEMTLQGWTVAEESAFAQIMQIGHLDRLPAIRLYRRSGELNKALVIAAAEAPTDAELARHKAFGEKMKALRLVARKSPHIESQQSQNQSSLAS
jgi:hypothetical protein